MLAISLQGLLAGCIFSIPAGPVSILIFKNTALHGLRTGLITLLGLVTAELIYITLYIAGLNDFLITHTSIFPIITMLGAAFIIALGMKSFPRNRGSKEAFHSANESKHTNPKNFLSSFFITICNPAILLFIITIVSLHFKTQDAIDFWKIFVLLISIELGTIIWFSSIIVLTSKYKNKFENFFNLYLPYISSIILTGFGLFILIKNIIGAYS